MGCSSTRRIPTLTLSTKCLGTMRELSCKTAQTFSAAARVPISTPGIGTRARSEEHTSELQSHLNLVCRLLLEKKKRCDINDTDYHHAEVLADFWPQCPC